MLQLATIGSAYPTRPSGASILTVESTTSRYAEAEWRTYQKRLERALFRLRWNQNQSLAVHQMPRYTQTEGSPFKSLRSRKATRGYPIISPGFTSARDTDPRAPSTAYRLPRLPPERHMRSRIQRDYVYKEPTSEAQFLLRKDPRTATPAAILTSPELRIKPRSTKCRPPQTAAIPMIRNISQSFPNGIKAHRLFPKLKHSLGNVPGFPVLTLEPVKSKDPQTPPQSENEYTLPTLHIRTSHTPTPPPSTARRNVDHLPMPPAQSSDWERRLTWQLSPYDNKNFDKQGLGPNQGPFSRELPRKCMPPTNWLRMKLRQRIQMRRQEKRKSAAVR